MGVRVWPWNWRNLPTMLNTLWNAALISIVTWGIIRLDPFEFRKTTSLCGDQIKPLFIFLTEFCLLYIYTGMFILSHLYFQVYSLDIIRLMDLPVFQEYYKSKRLAYLVFFAVLLINQLFFFSIIFDQTHIEAAIELKVSDSWDFARKCLSRFCVFNGSFFHIYLCNLFFYHEVALNSLLNQIYRKLTSGKVSISEAFQQVREFALLHQAFNEFYSIPTIIYLIFNTFQVVVPLCMVLLCQLHYGHLIHGFFTWFYLLYLLRLNQNIQLTVKRIFNFFEEQSKMKLISSEKPLGPGMTVEEFETFQKRQFLYHKYSQVDLYCEYFHWNLFNMVNINFALLLKLTLFILNYVVLITQTN